MSDGGSDVDLMAVYALDTVSAWYILVVRDMTRQRILL